MYPSESVSSPASGSDEDRCCAICFTEKTDFAILPCQCKIHYCTRCWDRALAMSFARVGHPQCPSCRSPFIAEFDAKLGRLVFSPATTSAAEANWRQRLYGKAKPVQIKLLHNFGCSCDHSQSHSQDGDCIDEWCKELHGLHEGSDSSSSDEESGGSSPHPTCACGAHLKLVTARRRLEMMLEEKDADWRKRPGVDAERLMQRLMQSRIVICDLCSDSATKSGAVWTCTNGARTVLHPTAYDVCEACFKKYAGLACSLDELGHAKVHSTFSRDDDKATGRCGLPLISAAKLAFSRGMRTMLHRPGGGSSSVGQQQ